MSAVMGREVRHTSSVQMSGPSLTGLLQQQLNMCNIWSVFVEAQEASKPRASDVFCWYHHQCTHRQDCKAEPECADVFDFSHTPVFAVNGGTPVLSFCYPSHDNLEDSFPIGIEKYHAIVSIRIYGLRLIWEGQVLASGSCGKLCLMQWNCFNCGAMEVIERHLRSTPCLYNLLKSVLKLATCCFCSFEQEEKAFLSSVTSGIPVMQIHWVNPLQLQK